VRHATPDDLAGREPLLTAIASRPGLTERGSGRFYRRSNAILHFHHDPAGLFADVKVDGEWVRVPVDEPGGADEVLATLDRALG
jgi:hypothetical protein